jgi:predicted DNA-binding helix-hairpin-helix protein
LNKVLRDKGLEGEEELVLWEDEVLEFIRCCCATAVDESISPFNGIIINPATAMAIASTDRFLISYVHTYEQTIYRIPGIAVAVPSTARVSNSEHRK